MKLINININKYFHMIPLWKSPSKLPVELPVELPVLLAEAADWCMQHTTGPALGKNELTNFCTLFVVRFHNF